jgi:fimbrial chaperone protein
MHQKPYRTAFPPPVVWFVLATLLGVLAAGGAHAQSLEVAPVRIEMAPGQMTTTILVTNRGKESTGVQARVFAWKQSGNDDQLTATKDVLISPPIAELQAGQTQLIRILRRKPAAATEATYRILIDQIPPAAAPTANGVRIALRLSLPIFVAPAQRAEQNLEWRVVSADGIEAELVARNRGARHVRVSDLSLSGPTGVALTASGSPYVLPGAERRWRLKGKFEGLRTGATLRLTGASDEGRIEAAPVLVPGP